MPIAHFMMPRGCVLERKLECEGLEHTEMEYTQRREDNNPRASF